MNVWVNEHDMGHLAGCHLILIMDVFEHAFVTDYGLKRNDYIEAFFEAIHWEEIENRYELALSDTVLANDLQVNAKKRRER